MARAFCVLSTPRTGSGYLRSLLDSHPQICCHPELFSHDWVDAIPVGPTIVDEELRARAPVRWLDAVIAESNMHDPGWRAVGFKLHLLQRPSVLERILFEPGFAVLLLDRADRLAQFASCKIADETREFRSICAKPGKPVTTRFDLAEFETFARQHDDLYRMVRTVIRGRTDILELDYDLLPEQGAHRRALEFLGVDATVTLSAPERKPNPDDVLARFTNPDEVVAALRRTPWARWLPEHAAQ